ncbi:MAG: tRNA (guanosine(46)-N7)-methyltransferase TrmB [Muribaculaceae bacterium]|nr:tRNA (guanosine(46)-N7)-methyltransferase TrmB [Muribaculaceae bacterium]
MGKNKLKKFAEMETFPNVFQFPIQVLKESGFPMKGKWGADYFENSNPIVLELGCGKGEYTVGLARRFPDMNFIGIDIKGARMWRGAKTAVEEGLKNVAFLRTNVELLENFFAPDEVHELWITFPDPQMKKFTKRLTATPFLARYRHFLEDGGVVNLKTDSPFLYKYTSALVEQNHLPVLAETDDLYATEARADILDIRTFYEQQWLDRGLSIKYIQFNLPREGSLIEPDVELEPDTYRSFSRGYIQCPQLLNDKNKTE